jgi:hypothetical protein
MRPVFSLGKRLLGNGESSCRRSPRRASLRQYDEELDFGPIYERRLVWNCRRVGTEKYNSIYIYEEHHTHRAHWWRRRPRRCVSTNTASNTPSTKTSPIPAEFNAKKPQNLERQKL